GAARLAAPTRISLPAVARFPTFPFAPPPPLVTIRDTNKAASGGRKPPDSHAASEPGGLRPPLTSMLGPDRRPLPPAFSEPLCGHRLHEPSGGTRMLRFESQKGVEFCDGLTRRDFLRVGSLSAGAIGLSLADLTRMQRAGAAGKSNDINCIVLFLV